MSHEITQDQLLKLAHDMVAAGNVSSLYGIDVFITAKNKFEESLRCFAEQWALVEPPPPPPPIQIPTGIPDIPDFLKMK